MISADLNVILPEIVLSLFAILALLGAVYTSKDKTGTVLVWATAAVMILLAIWIGMTGTGETRIAFNGLFIEDGFARFAKVTILLSAPAVLIMSNDYMRARGLLRFEYPVLIALSVVGMMMMVSAGDLMSLYMGLELQSLALYVVASLRRDSIKSTEAGLKYFVLGALSSGMLLYGTSLVYGYAGTTQFAGVMSVAQSGHTSLGLLFGIVFLMAGLAFKVSAVPFHMWTPDVYEGAPTPVTAAYSSIAHMGYALIGLAAGTQLGVKAMLVYMAIYVTMNIGTFAFILSMEKDGQPVTDISALNMYSKRAPGKALAMLVLLFSLAGVPPMLGFFAKFGVWQAGVDAGLIWLVAASAVASAIGAYYYLRIVFLMYFGEEGDDRLDGGKNGLLTGFLIASAVIMVVGIANMFGVEEAAIRAAATLVN